MPVHFAEDDAGAAPRRFAQRVMLLGVVVVSALALAIPRFHNDTAGPGPDLRGIQVAPAPVGTLGRMAPDSAVVIVYGDSRTGHRVLTQRSGARMLYEAAQSHRPSMWLAGLENLPATALEVVYPDFMGLRDVWSTFVSHRFTGGNQPGVLRALEANTAVDLIVNTGDLVEDGRQHVQWEEFAGSHAALRNLAPFVAAPGNHEALWKAAARRNWDAIMGPPRAPFSYWSSVALGRLARFVILDSNLFTDPHDHYPPALEQALVDEQLAWADSMLAGPERFKFVVLHHPLVTSGHHWDEWTSQDEHPAQDRRIQLLEILRRRHVTAVLAGHEHLFQRSWISEPGGGGLWHITTGGGGSPLHYVTDDDRRRARTQSLPDSAAIGEMFPEQSVYHYCRLVLRPDPAPGMAAAELRIYRVDSAGAARLIDTVDLASPPGGPAVSAADHSPLRRRSPGLP